MPATNLMRSSARRSPPWALPLEGDQSLMLPGTTRAMDVSACARFCSPPRLVGREVGHADRDGSLPGAGGTPRRHERASPSRSSRLPTFLTAWNAISLGTRRSKRTQMSPARYANTRRAISAKKHTTAEDQVSGRSVRCSQSARGAAGEQQAVRRSSPRGRHSWYSSQEHHEHGGRSICGSPRRSWY
jgi:hypothetical protein